MPCKEDRPRPVTLSAQEAEAELETAAASLEMRARLLRIPTKRVATEEWRTLAAQFGDFVPLWYCELLSRFSLYGVALENRDNPDKTFICGFAFNGPPEYAAILSQGSLYHPLRLHGFVPIGDDPDGDGNIWIIENPATAGSAVYRLVLSEWNGSKPTTKNGLQFAASRLSLLLCAMGIGEASYHVSPSGVTSLMWHEDRKSRGHV
jgi:hypothetical protein